jgi:hypothetical protein
MFPRVTSVTCDHVGPNVNAGYTALAIIHFCGAHAAVDLALKRAACVDISSKRFYSSTFQPVKFVESVNYNKLFRVLCN